MAREADVIELNLIEAEAADFFRSAQVILPECAVVGVHPRQPFLVPPGRPVGLPDCPCRIETCRDGVLEDHDARDGGKVVRMQSVEEAGQVRNCACAAGISSDESIGGHVVDTEFVLDVDNERIDLGRISQLDQRTHFSRTLRREAIDV